MLDARASGDVGSAPDSSFELAVAAAGALAARAFADSRRVRARRRGRRRRARERDRAHGGAQAARARAPGAASARRVSCSARLAAERIEVVTSRPAALVGAPAPAAARRRRDRPVELRPRGAARRRRARGAAGGRRARAWSCGGREREPAAATPRPRAPRARAARRALRRVAGASACCTRATSRSRRSRRRGSRRSPPLATAPGARSQRCATRPHARGRPRSCGPRSPAWTVGARARGACGRLDLGRLWPSSGSPLGGLAGQLARRARRAGSRWCCRSRAESTRSCGRSCSSRCSPGSRRWRGCGSCGRAPWPQALLALLPFAVSATVYELPQHPLRALVAGALLLAFLFTGRAAGGGRAARRRVRGAGARDRRRLGRRARGVASDRAALDDVDVRGRRRRRSPRSIWSGT